MDSENRPKQSEEERKRMLEAIRRRSEEAELKRLEDEESKRLHEEVKKTVDPEPESSETLLPPEPIESFPPPVPPAAEEIPFEPPVEHGFSPFPVPDANPSALSAEEQQRALILKEKFLIAIDRGKSDKASEILSELNLVLPHEEILELREKLHQLEEEGPRKKGKKRRDEPLPEVPPRPEPADRSRKGDHRKRISELLETVNTAYQQEKYAAALMGIDQILELDNENDEALRLKEEIVRAQQLAEQIAREDEKRRREEAAARSAIKKSDRRSGRIQSEHRSGMQVSDKDVWGSSMDSKPLGVDIMPEEKGPAAPPKPPVIDRVTERVSRIKIPVKPLLIILGVVAAVVVGYIIIDNIRNAVAPPLYSVLVFPPTTNPTDSLLRPVAEGFAVDLTQDLYAVSDLRVIGMSTATALDASTMAPLQRCRAVGSNFYLRWSLGQQGEAILFQADLYDTSSSKPLWTSRKVTSMKALAQVKNELAHALVAAMNIKVTEDDQQSLKTVSTSNEYAYIAYLRARTMLRHPESYPIATVIQTLGDAVIADSSFGRAQSALGWTHILAYEGGDRTSSHLTDARACVQRAVNVVLRNPEAYRVWGAGEFSQGQYDKAVERFEQAVAIAPSDVESQCRLAKAYIARNETDAALKAANRAVMDDPWVETTWTILGQVQEFIAIAHGGSPDDYAHALQSYEQGMKFAPDRSEYGSSHLADVLLITQQPERALSLMVDRLARARQSARDLYILGRVEQSAGKPKAEWQEAFLRAQELLKSAVASHPDDALSHSQLALIHTRLGEFREAIASNQRALKLAPADPAILYNAARMYTMQNDRQQAKEFLAKAIDRSFSLTDILDRDLFGLHSEPDFVKVVTR